MLYSRTIGTGQDLVLLHGWGFSSALFDNLVGQYQHKYRITVIDLPGHGRSNIVKGGLDEWCDGIIKVLPKNPILLGWSLGGLLAIHIANQISLNKLILVASSPNFVQTDDWHYGIDADNFQQFANALELDLSKGLKRFVSLQITRKSKLRAINQAIEKFPAHAKALHQGLEILLSSNLVHEFKQLKLPIEVILGADDTLVANDIYSWYASQGINVRMIDTGHLPFLDEDFKL